jgi:hypothetical protein
MSRYCECDGTCKTQPCPNGAVESRVDLSLTRDEAEAVFDLLHHGATTFADLTPPEFGAMEKLGAALGESK